MIAKVPDIPVRSHPLSHVDEYLEIGQKAGASDVHLAVNAQPIWRLHGTLQPMCPEPPRLGPEATGPLAENFVLEVYKEDLKNGGDAIFAYTTEFAGTRPGGVPHVLAVELV